jgi:two-component system, sensor histidine kinase and response regulator
MNETIKILVVDDVPQNRAAIEAVLARPDLELLDARSGDEALELLLVQEVALALIDVRMPGMDGFELAELMRGAERTRAIPIIFMTAATQDPVRTFRGYEAGAVDFLHKPFDPVMLRSKIGVFVELYSQRRRIEAQLGELQRALRLNETFAAVLGHDLRNPLNAIALGAEALLHGSKDDKVRRVAERIRSSTRRMAKMIEQLLDVARIRAGGVSLAMRPGNVAEVCGTIRDELEGVHASRRIAVSARGDTAATFDADRLSQVFSNLVGNALQHSTPDTPVAVTIDGGDPELVKVRICNEGSIPAERLKTLFEPFQSSGPQGSLGLGLYIARQFVQAHGGDVQAISKPGEPTTTFEFSIRRVPAAAAAADAKVAL